MAGLKDTLGKLAAQRRSAGPAPRIMRESAEFGSNPGALRMLSHVPEGLAAGAPLVVVLHGCAQHAEAFAETGGWLALSERCGFAVLAPEQTAANNPNLCFNWFLPGDTRRGKGEAASIFGMIGALKRQYGLGDVYVTGLSAGGAMAAAMLAAYPDVFAGGAVIAGLPYGAAGNVQQAMAAMHGAAGPDIEQLADLMREAAPTPERAPTLSIWHGGADVVVSRGNAARIAGQWAAAHGLSARPDETQMLFGRTRSVWRNADGEPVMDLNLLPAMGHGWPLATTGPEGLGTAAPFMLETGVPSTLEIARFWKIAPEASAPEAPAPAQDAPSAHPIGDRVMAEIAKHVPGGVQDTLARAMRAAGLLS